MCVLWIVENVFVCVLGGGVWDDVVSRVVVGVRERGGVVVCEVECVVMCVFGVVVCDVVVGVGFVCVMIGFVVCVCVV